MYLKNWDYCIGTIYDMSKLENILELLYNFLKEVILLWLCQAFDNPDKCYLYTTTLSPPPTNQTTSNTTTETTTNTTTESTPIITTIKTYIPTTSTHKTTTSNPATQSTTATSQSSQASGQQDRNGCLPGV